MRWWVGWGANEKISSTRWGYIPALSMVVVGRVVGGECMGECQVGKWAMML
jgi:hypothetical protein